MPDRWLQAPTVGSQPVVMLQFHELMPLTSASSILKSVCKFSMILASLVDLGIVTNLCVCVWERVSVCVCAIHEAPAKRELRLY